jgi:hypothetical protein
VFIFSFDMIPSRFNNPLEVDAFYQQGLVDSSILLFSEDYRSMITNSRTAHPDIGISYWMSASNVVDYTRPCYELTGITNLPAGETLTYSFFWILALVSRACIVMGLWFPVKNLE